MSQNQKSPDPVAAARAAIRDEYTRLSPGRIAAIVTHLEMYVRPPLRPEPAGHGFELKLVPGPDLEWYRGLYRAVGENWLWFSRLTLDDDKLACIIRDSAVRVYALRRAGRDAGILELDARRFPDIELAFFGLVEGAIGKGGGRFMMNRALDLCWSRSPRRVTVHTCTLDHPSALEFYLRSGFKPYARSVEIADDPRLHGLLSRSAAPHVPILG
jgi:GNAT superfamily N-acetyltransferase